VEILQGFLCSVFMAAAYSMVTESKKRVTCS